MSSTSPDDQVRRLPDPTLFVLVGASGSGKTHWAAENFAPEQVVSSDRLRAAVGESAHDQGATADAFALLDQMVAMRLGRRLTTVVDSTGLDEVRRRAWRTMAATNGVPVVAVAFGTPAAVCRARNRARARPVPVAVLAGQLRRFGEVRERLPLEGYAAVLAPAPVRVVPPAFLAPVTAAAPVRAPAGEGLQFGLHLSSFAALGGAAGLRDAVRDVAARAEAAGFDSLWVMDHFRQIPQVGRAWDDFLESTATLGYLAAATERVSIGALVHGITYRNVGHLAKIVATLDVLSGGRAWCGLGAAWFEAEHRAYGWQFPPTRERLDMLEEALQALPLLWGPGSPAYTGRYVHVPEALAYPRPLGGRVPLLVGGSGRKRTLRLAAQYADACNLFGDPAAVRGLVDVLQGHCAAIGRAPADVQVTHLSTALVAGDASALSDALVGVPRREAGRLNPGTVADHVLRVRALEQAGVQHVIVALPGVWDEGPVERFAEVMRAFR